MLIGYAYRDFELLSAGDFIRFPSFSKISKKLGSLKENAKSSVQKAIHLSALIIVFALLTGKEKQGDSLPFKPKSRRITDMEKAKIKHICAYDEGRLAVGNRKNGRFTGKDDASETSRH